MGHAKVAVLLPTYNGEKYIEGLLDSLHSQTYQNIDLYVRDDGSSDNTIALILRHAKRRNALDRLHIIDEGGPNIGCMKGFFFLANSVDADYYFFCDQDDVWLSDKVERAVLALSCNEGSPSVYFSSFDYCDEEGELIRHAPSQRLDIGLAETLFYTPGLGFTIAFNRLARDSFMSVVGIPCEMHDRWILRCAAAMGKIEYDSKPCARHIRHRDAVTASDNTLADLLDHYLKQELFGEGLSQTVRGIKQFGELFSEKLGEDDKEIVELFSQYGGGAAKRLRKAFFGKRLRATMVSELLLRLLFLVGKA